MPIGSCRVQFRNWRLLARPHGVPRLLLVPPFALAHSGSISALPHGVEYLNGADMAQAYMERLGMWGIGTAFKDFSAFKSCIEKSGFGAMELVALDMKRRGM